MFESLRSLSDSQIISGTKAARAQEHGGMLSMIGFLVETERRKIHLKLGHSSLFDYCTTGLGHSESQAMRRITAARCIVKFPDVFPLLEASEINLGTISRVSKILTAENCSTILQRIRKRSLREVEAIAAEYEPVEAFPRDRVRTVVVRVPVPPIPAVGQNHLRYDGEKSSSVEQSTANRYSEESPATVVVQSGLQLERRKRVEFIAHDELMAKLDRIRSLASHRLPTNASLEQLIDFMAEYVLQREDPEARQERRVMRAARQAVARPSASSNPRQIPARVRDQVFMRDKRCTYVSPNGKRCGSTHVLQIDHIKPVARGGASTVDNLRLLCAFHNRLEAERLMGCPAPPPKHQVP
jgi:5-methylcytosine-specific restriction endonuclease McrA